MSADNGIYIMHFIDQSRVIHAQTIEELNWSFLKFDLVDHFIPTRIVEYYKNATPMSNDKAIEYAHDLYHEILCDDFGYIEYGIREFSIARTWDQVMGDAKILAKKELDSIKKKKENNKWRYEIESLNNILNMGE
jgi:hypothetical protein